jgi:hypothetical protein
MSRPAKVQFFQLVSLMARAQETTNIMELKKQIGLTGQWWSRDGNNSGNNNTAMSCLEFFFKLTSEMG